MLNSLSLLRSNPETLCDEYGTISLRNNNCGLCQHIRADERAAYRAVESKMQLSQAESVANGSQSTTIDSRVASKSNEKTFAIIGYISNLLGVWPIGLAIALIDGKSGNEMIRTHYRYMIRTVLIGLLYVAVSFVLSFVLIGFVMMIATGVWYIVRCVKGLIYISRDQPIDNAGTWLV